MVVVFIALAAWLFVSKKQAIAPEALKDASLGGALSEGTGVGGTQPLEKLPNVNPFNSVETNPYKQGYTNPFAR